MRAAAARFYGRCISISWRCSNGGSDLGNQYGQAQRLPRPGGRRAWSDGQRRVDRVGRQARPVQGDGWRRADQLGRAGREDRHGRALCANGSTRAAGALSRTTRRPSAKLPAERAMVLANEDSPAFVGGVRSRTTSSLALIESAFRRSGLRLAPARQGVATGCAVLPPATPTWCRSGCPRRGRRGPLHRANADIG